MNNFYLNNINSEFGGKKKVPADEITKRKEEIKKGMLDKSGMLNMTEQEGKSVNAYSLGTYKKINTRLRGGLMTGQNDQNKFGAKDQAYTLTTISALNKLKTFKGTVYRHSDIFPGYEEVNQEGAIVTDMGFTSTTYRPESLQSQFGKDIIEIIKSKTGRFIKPMATLFREDEVLFKPGTRFRVTKRYTAGLDPADPAKREWPEKMDPAAKDVLKKDEIGHQIKYIVFKEEV